jgi:OPA family glycerol-3-phosphate transporter-like MFS transporter
MSAIPPAENDVVAPGPSCARVLGDGDPRSARWRLLTLGLMVLGYSGYYLCRSNLAVATPLILSDLGAQGMDPDRARVGLGEVATAGVLAYAVGKLLGGSLGDFLGGRRNFLLGMAGAIGFTALFALGGSIPLFTLAWVGNRLFQAMGWPGVVKVASRWFGHASHGLVMGILSLSFLWGDAINRVFLGALIDLGLGWRGVFTVTAGVMAALWMLNGALLRESPLEVGLEEPTPNPQNVFGEHGADPVPPSPRAVVIPLLRSPVFGLVCLLSFGLTLVRESFNLWSATYFAQEVRLAPGAAARVSAWFPLLGGFSVLLAGALGDRLGRGGRAIVMLVGLLLASGALGALGILDPAVSKTWPIALVAVEGFLVIGPYSYLAGAMALDLGGKRGGATASALIDFVGYLGGALSGSAIAAIAVNYGWRGVFLALGLVALAAAAVAAVLLLAQRSASD